MDYEKKNYDFLKTKHSYATFKPFYPPNPLKVWSVECSPSKKDLRFCNADFCLGFINNDEKDLEIEVVVGVGGGIDEKKIMHYSLKKDEQTDWKIPLWFSKDVYTEFQITNRSHHNFFILYAWLPHKIINRQHLPELNMNLEN